MKNLKKYALAATVAVVAGFGIYLNQPKEQMSDVMLANIEALSQSEDSYTGTLYGNQQGTMFCCCPGSTRTCGASYCYGC